MSSYPMAHKCALIVMVGPPPSVACRHSASRGSFAWCADVVPEVEDRLVAPVVLEAEHAYAGGAAEEHPPGGRRQAEPAGRDHPDHVAAGKRQDVAVEVMYPGEEAIG